MIRLLTPHAQHPRYPSSSLVLLRPTRIVLFLFTCTTIMIEFGIVRVGFLHFYNTIYQSSNHATPCR